MSYLYNISCVLPRYKMAQHELATYMAGLYDLTDKELQRIHIMYNRSGIGYRYSCIPDFDPTQKKILYSDDATETGMNERMAMFFKEALPLALKASTESIRNQNITHLLTVSCTGMAAPGLDLMLLKALNLPAGTERSAVNFMGCYALFHAFKNADYICRSTPGAKVLIVSVELCTLHFQKAYSPNQVAANLLFGDGASACIISADRPQHEPYFSLSRFYSEIIDKGAGDMTWRLSETGFLMTLSAYIPALIQEGIGAITAKSLKQLLVQQQVIKHWAIHPGGRKILDHIKSELGLPEGALDHSYKVLHESGNLSSATLLFVLNEIISGDDYNSTQPVFAAGFGPGLTVETMLLNIKA